MDGPIAYLFSLARDFLGLVGRVLDHVPLARAALGTVLTLILPGLAWTLVLFRSGNLSVAERLALSVGISIAGVTLSVYAANLLLGMRISAANATLVILGLTLVPALWLLGRHLLARRLKARDCR